MKNTLLLATTLLLACAGVAPAQILYEDFTSSQPSGPLAGTAPSPDELSTAGTSPPTPPAVWITSGNAGISGTFGYVSGNSNTSGATASLPFDPVAGNIYTLTAHIAVTSGSGTGFAALGFTSSSASASTNFYALGLGPFLQLDSYDGGVQTYAAPVPGLSSPFAATSNPGGSFTGTVYSIVLNTQATDWTVAFYQGLTQLGTTYTYNTGNPVINDVAFGTDTYDAGYYNNFKLEEQIVTAPEPSSYSLLGLGVLALIMVRRFSARRRA